MNVCTWERPLQVKPSCPLRNRACSWVPYYVLQYIVFATHSGLIITPCNVQAVQRNRFTQACFPAPMRARMASQRNWKAAIAPHVNLGVPTLLLILEPRVVWNHSHCNERSDPNKVPGSPQSVPSDAEGPYEPHTQQVTSGIAHSSQPRPASAPLARAATAVLAPAFQQQHLQNSHFYKDVSHGLAGGDPTLSPDACRLRKVPRSADADGSALEATFDISTAFDVARPMPSQVRYHPCLDSCLFGSTPC